MNKALEKIYREMNRPCKLSKWKPIRHGTAEGWRYECLKSLKDETFKRAFKKYCVYKNIKFLKREDVCALLIGEIYYSKNNKLKLFLRNY